MRQAVIQLVTGMVGNAYLYFNTYLEVKKTPHSLPTRIWAVCVSPDDRIYLMDHNEEWFEVKEDDTLIISSLHQRVRFLHQSLATKQKEVSCV